jgi:hypothetical protein
MVRVPLLGEHTLNFESLSVALGSLGGKTIKTTDNHGDELLTLVSEDGGVRGLGPAGTHAVRRDLGWRRGIDRPPP